MLDARQELQSFLSYERFRFSLRLTAKTALPGYKGSVFRGAFGSAFRKVVCVHRAGDCAVCGINERCLYRSVFEPAAPPEFPDAGKYGNAPPPYLIVPPLTDRRSFDAGETLDFELTLMGPTVSALPYFLFAFTELGRMGLGRERGGFELAHVEVLKNGEASRIFDGATGTLKSFDRTVHTVERTGDEARHSVTLHLLTPLRLKVKKELVTELTFPLLFERLAERLHLLAALYGSRDRLPDLAAHGVLARDVRTTGDELHWHEWTRYSGRQKTTMNFGGLMGRISFEGPLGPLMPSLRMGEHLNVGQHTTFGLGRFRIIV